MVRARPREMAHSDPAVEDLIDTVHKLCSGKETKRVTLLCAARDKAHNNAITLRDYLRERLGN